MLNFKLGHIGKNEIERAIKVLEENKDIKNIFVRISRNDEVRGAEYDSIEDLLSDSDEDYIYSFSNKEEYIEYIDEDEENHSDILELFNNGTVHCDFENKRFSNEVEDIVKPIIECGDYCNYYSREEAIENLNGSNVDESLVGYILNEYYEYNKMFEITKTTSDSDGYGGLIVSVVNSENEEIWNRFDSYNEDVNCISSVVSKDLKTVYFIDEVNGFYAVDISLKKDLDTKDLFVDLDFDNCRHIDSIGFDIKLIISDNEKFAYILSEKQFFIIDIEYPKIVSQLEILDKESYEECDDMSLSSDEHNVIITTSDEKSVIINIEDVSNSKIVKGELK